MIEYLPLYMAEQNRRHSVLPGIKGWAQINRRNLTGFSERLKLDLWYVDHWSLWIDIKIMARTLINVLRSSGVKLEQSLTEIDDGTRADGSSFKSGSATSGSFATLELPHHGSPIGAE